MENLTVLGLDGNDSIIYSESFNIYENKLVISNFLNKKFTFIFENTEPVAEQRDVNTVGTDDELTITFSKKFRNSLGSGTTNKVRVLETDNGKFISFSIFGQQIGESALSIVLNFYIN